MTRRGYSPAIDAMIDSFDGGDPFGSAMSMAWAVAECGRAMGEPEPGQRLNYRPSPLSYTRTIDDLADDTGGDYETTVLAQAIRDGRVTVPDLVVAARVLNRYLNLCRKAGRDY